MHKLPHTGNIYFLGIGGIGMSALARYFLIHGWNVHGYDRPGMRKIPGSRTLEVSGVFFLGRGSFRMHQAGHLGFIITSLGSSRAGMSPRIPEKNTGERGKRQDDKIPCAGMCADCCSRHVGSCAPLYTLVRCLGACPQPSPRRHREQRSVYIPAGEALLRDRGAGGRPVRQRLGLLYSFSATRRAIPSAHFPGGGTSRCSSAEEES